MRRGHLRLPRVLLLVIFLGVTQEPLPKGVIGLVLSPVIVLTSFIHLMDRCMASFWVWRL